jgi:hypothetical protein
MKLLIMKSSPASRHFLPLRSKYFPQHPFSDTLNLCSSLSVWNHISHRYKTTGKIRVSWRVIIIIIIIIIIICIRDQTLTLQIPEERNTETDENCRLIHVG